MFCQQATLFPSLKDDKDMTWSSENINPYGSRLSSTTKIDLNHPKRSAKKLVIGEKRDHQNQVSVSVPVSYTGAVVHHVPVYPLIHVYEHDDPMVEYTHDWLYEVGLYVNDP